MFFWLSKTAGALTVPSTLLVVVGLGGAVLMLTRFARFGRSAMVVAVLGLGVAGLTPLGTALLLPLENRFPVWNAGRVDGVVILGGAVNAEATFARKQPAVTDAAERLMEGVALARRFPDASLVFTGGDPSLIVDRPPEGAAVQDILDRLGVEPARVRIESQSRNTVENAVFTRALVQPQPGQTWLLVTSAAHMPRAIGTFRQAGFAVVAYPVDFHTLGDSRDLLDWSGSVAGRLRRVDNAVHEWIGLAAYRLTGRSAALFPGPD